MLQKFRFFIIIIILILVYLPGFAKLQELKQKLSETEIGVKKALNDIGALEQKLSQMKNQEYLEIVAREKMGVVKKGETVIKIIREGEEVPAALNTENATFANTTKKQ
jgi:cell division protein FtsB